MNSPTTPIPDLEGLRKAVQEFRPNPRRVPFTNLKTVHDCIAKLREQQVSYATIADLLQQHGVKTSRARVAEYGRIVLDGGKSRKRRKHAKPLTVINISAASQSTPAIEAKPLPATIPPSNVSPWTREDPAFVTRGPRIAKIEMLSPEEVAALKAEKAAKSQPS
jgi:hypothetical protein